eukprot:jgi/Mesen1/4259/ME000022S03544
MEAYICQTCGVQYAPSAAPPEGCKICLDDRQYVPKSGQKWTTHGELEKRHRNEWQLVEAGMYGIASNPKIGIGQRALIIETPGGNVMWDCITLLDAATAALLHALGGLRAIAISHPHYYATAVQWSTAFSCPIYIHARDKAWVCYPHENVRLWEGATHSLGDGLTLVHVGGHFAGAQVLHWARGAGGKGALLTGDILQVAADKATVSVMRSYPNLIPVSAAQIERIREKLKGWEYERLHGAFWDFTIEADAKRQVEYSLERYLKWLSTDDELA